MFKNKVKTKFVFIQMKWCIPQIVIELPVNALFVYP